MVSGGNVKKGSTGHPQSCSCIRRLSVHGPATAAPGSGGLHCRKTVVCKVMTSCWQKMHTFRCPFWVVTSVFFMLNKLRHFDSKYYCWISISQKQFSLAFLLKVPSTFSGWAQSRPTWELWRIDQGRLNRKVHTTEERVPVCKNVYGPFTESSRSKVARAKHVQWPFWQKKKKKTTTNKFGPQW